MLVTLLDEEGMSSLMLSAKKMGRYQVCDRRNGERLITIERTCNRWMLESNKRVFILDDYGRNAEKVCLRHGNLYSLYRNEVDILYHLFVEPADSIRYERYIVRGNEDLYIGRMAENTICFQNIAVSAVHGRLSRNGDTWMLYDENSTNGIYVNHIRIKNSIKLKPGDVIYIMGLRLIIGKGFLAVNNPDGCVELDKNRIFPYCSSTMPHGNKKKEQVLLPEYFCKFQRRAKIGETFTVKQCGEIIEKGTENLWEREQTQQDFLKLRVGRNIETVNLKAYSIAGILGRWEDSLAFAKGLLVQMMTYYGYDELKLVFVLNDEAEKEFKNARWLPHVWDDEWQVCMAIRNLDDGKLVSDYLKKERKRQISAVGEAFKCQPYYMFFVFNRKLWKKLEGFHTWLQGADRNAGIVYFADDRGQLSQECRLLLEVNGCEGYISYSVKEESAAYDKLTEHLTEVVCFNPIYVRQDIDLWYLKLANTELFTGQKKNKSAGCRTVELYVPAVGKSFDIKIPKNHRIWWIVQKLEREIEKRTAGQFCSDGKAILCEREVGIVLNPERTPDETGILNGTRLMLI